MSKADIRRLDKEIQRTEKKLDAVRRGEWWPLTSRERLSMSRAMAGGARSVYRDRSTTGAETRMDSIGSAVERRLNAELTALHGERQRLITEAARAKAERKKSGWF
ncbi:hypothetical protein [Streptomyces chartreusis]|uniref:hypothetical protein n=1 Tax=Streptomyces chartreusis TaxID=1969 RepID=UPI0033DB168D